MKNQNHPEITIPILPSCSIHETLTFYQALGFTVTYQQKRPNSYAVVRLRGIELHFFVLKPLQPADNYSTCYIVVEQIDELYQAFTAGIRTLMGKMPVRGIPRINPLKDIPAYGVRQFIVVDPSGNYIRIGKPIPKTHSLVYPEDEDTAKQKGSPLEKALELSTRMADAKGDFITAANVLDKALSNNRETEPLTNLRAQILRADLAIRQREFPVAAHFLAEAEKTRLSFPVQSQISEEIRLLAELKTLLLE